MNNIAQLRKLAALKREARKMARSIPRSKVAARKAAAQELRDWREKYDLCRQAITGHKKGLRRSG